MGSTDSRVPGALMVNLLGLEQELSEQEQHERLAALAALPGSHLHWYGKAQAAPGRKLGHLTLVLAGSSSADRQGERDRLLAEVRRIWPLPEAIEPPKNPLE
jgi:5-(carboxyamino)imidazole ribonucleotide synthase